MTSRTATLIRQPDGTAKLFTPYSEAFVERLKATIPVSLRRWDKADKCWVVSGSGITQAVILAQVFYDRIDEITEPAPRSAGTPTPFAILHLLDDAPADLVPVVYRHLAKVNHPDRGGDTREMQRLNEAYETICKAVVR